MFSSRKDVIMFTYSRGPMTSLAWGPVGHCTSGRPLNPPLQRYITVELMFAVYAQRRRRSRHTTLQLLRRSRLPSSHGFPATTEATLYTTFCGQYTQTCVDPRFCQNVPSRLQLFALIVPNKPINIIITTVYFIRHKCRSCYH